MEIESIESGDITVIANSIIAAADLGGNTVVQKQLTSGTIQLSMFQDMIKRYNAYVEKYKARPAKILDRLEGKSKNPVEFSGVDGEPIQVEQTLIQIAFRQPSDEHPNASKKPTAPKGERKKG